MWGTPVRPCRIFDTVLKGFSHERVVFLVPRPIVTYLVSASLLGIDQH